MSTALEMKPEEWRKFKPGRKISTRAIDIKYLEERRAKGLELAKKASFLLRQRYGAKRVVVFGSLARRNTFGAWSDIDHAAWGIGTGQVFLGRGCCDRLEPRFQN